MHDEQPSQPPDDSVVPWQPATAYRQLVMTRQHLEESPEIATGASALDLVLTMLEYMACPHPECPRLLLEHHEHG